ncbi:protein WHAT'S THIS FACTOR 1 homolog, chloroplastic [Impatiens glandulifera]|uniref:protein WHAT'S THIS FACTOR 1 homolog, chloroplastic n=1 Tax=Impatiens glandulifera TaxID=253017 RepID=UPI001FB0A46A|nr:protein WHAT'S THIS FACTOR 1 homolog, chloroplastic [Impatiens glandulifera]
MACSLFVSYQREPGIITLSSEFLQIRPSLKVTQLDARRCKTILISLPRSAIKIPRDRSLDKHVSKTNKIRFIQKLKTLLLSKPKHFMPLSILSKCRSYLSLSKPHSIISMIQRYPSIFELFTIPFPQTPLNATKQHSQLCVRLTPSAEALATRESNLKSSVSLTLATKLQKLLMLSSYRRILLTKLIHLGPDLGLPTNFTSRLCNEYPDKFRTVDTSYGRALELVSWDPQLACVLPAPKAKPDNLIVDRPLKFKHLRLQKGVNVKRLHREFLIKFNEMEDICPYESRAESFPKESIEAEKRSCALVREILGMTLEKRTLIDHLTHFRKDFDLPNKLRGMLIRHPELFYISFKGQRDSVFLFEGYDEKGRLFEKDEILVIRDGLMELAREGKRMRRERRKVVSMNNGNVIVDELQVSDDDDEDDYADGLDSLFDSDDDEIDDDYDEFLDGSSNEQFWSTKSNVVDHYKVDQNVQPW